MTVNLPEPEGEALRATVGLRCHISLTTVLQLLYVPPFERLQPLEHEWHSYKLRIEARPASFMLQSSLDLRD